jgi:hypothetical protein
VLDPNITTQDELLHLMSIGDVWIERSGSNSFFYLVERQGGRVRPINQQLAKSTIHHFSVTQQRWYQGWGSPKATSISRWIVEGAVED